MHIVISNSDQRPIYEQVYDAIRAGILSGEIGPGGALPSIRGLAKDLRISVITTKRAYEELERDGYIHTVQGKGCFVAERGRELMREQSLRDIEEHLRSAVALARASGVTDRELAEMLTILEEESK